jgi:hypothetical protein
LRGRISHFFYKILRVASRNAGPATGRGQTRDLAKKRSEGKGRRETQTGRGDRVEAMRLFKAYKSLAVQDLTIDPEVRRAV